MTWHHTLLAALTSATTHTEAKAQAKGELEVGSFDGLDSMLMAHT